MRNYEEFIQGLKKKKGVPDKVWSQFEETLASLPDRPAQMRGRRKPWRMLSAAAAIVLLIAAGGVCAVAYTNPVLASKLPFIGKIFEQVEEDVTFSGTYSSEASRKEIKEQEIQAVTDAGITVTPSELYCDGYSLFMTFEVDLEEQEIGNIMERNADAESGEGSGTQVLYLHADVGMDGTQEKWFGYLEGKAVDDHTFIGMTKVDFGGEKRSEGTLDFSLTSISYDTEADDPASADLENHVAYGSWNFEFPFEADSENAREIQVNQKNDQGYGVKSVALSQYQLVIHLELPYTTLSEEEFSREDFQRMWEAKTEGMDPVPEPPFTYEEFLAQKNYASCYAVVYDQDGNAYRPVSMGQTAKVVPTEGRSFEKLTIFLGDDLSLIDTRTMEEAQNVAFLAAEVEFAG